MKLVVVFSLFSISSIFAYQNFHGCALASDNHAIGWVVTLDSMLILHTTDGGANWQEQTNPATRKFFDVTCVDTMHAWTCGILGEIMCTTNGGQGWAVQAGNLAKYATRIEFYDVNFGWVSCGDGTIGRTTNGGGYWEQVFTTFPNLPEFYGVSFTSPTDVWMVAGWPDTLETGQGWIVHSVDGGTIWDSVFQCSDYSDYLNVRFLDAQTGIVVGGDDQTYNPIILKTTDGGVSWNSIPAPANAYYLRAVDFIGNNGWAVGRFGSIIHTSDGGDTWIFQNNPATQTLFDVDFADVQHGLACGYGIVLYTTDGGQTWNNSTPAIAETDIPQAVDGRMELHPNPFRKKTKIKFEIRNPKFEMSLKIFDASGRLVKSFAYSPGLAPRSGAGLVPSAITWDGIDEIGRKVPAGVYFVKLTAPGETMVEKVILLK